MKSQTKHILSAAVLLASVLFGSLTNTYAAGEQEQYHIIYHDQNGSVIKRIPFTADYKFDEDVPPFFVELPYKNVAWTTEPHGEGTRYDKNSDPITSLTEDLNVYAELKKGHFVRFDSLGGTPVEYQFVLPGGKVIKPTDPTKAGYSFNNWSDVESGSAFDFNTVITEDTQLKATWTPKEVNYTVRVWLEKASHPNRSDLEDAIANVTNDYAYAVSFTKTGITNKKAEFTDTDRSNDKIQSLIYSNTTAGMNPSRIQTYFYDDNDDSFAKSLTEYDIQSINDNGGIAADGTTVMNVYYRRYYWMAKLYSNSNALVSQGVPKDRPGWTFELRNGETVRDALSRKSYNGQSASYLDKLNEQYPTFMNWMNKDISRDPFIFRLEAHDGYNDGTYLNMLSRTFDVLAMQNSKRFDDGFYFKDNDQLDLKLDDANNKGDYEWHRYHYVQTIESARANNETDYTHANENNFELKHENVYYFNYSDYNQLCSWSNTPLAGCQYYFIQSVKRDNSGKITDYYPNKMKDGYDGHPHQFVSSSTYPGMPYRLEFYLLRKRYLVDFEAYDFVTYKAPNPPAQGVVYEDEVSRVAPGIKTKDAGGNEIRFVIDETQFKDSKEVVWVFKGWYDSELFLGDPIDFTTTKLKMTASAKHFYAKWEPKTITATYDGNGGKVEGHDKLDKPQPSGVIPERPADPVPPEGMFFYCWTVNGKVYDFQDPITDDTELVALYYNDTKANKVTYDAGLGTGDVPVDSNNYLIDANAGVLSPGDALVPPVGQKFLNWTDEEGRSYTPGQDVIIKGDVTLKAAFSGLNAGIIIRRKGLIANDKVTESATYQIFKDGAAVPMMVVSLTGKDASGSVVSTSISRLALGTYTVKESSWTWAYDIGETKVIDGDTTVTSDTPGTGTGELKEDHTLIFDFTGEHKEEVSKHDEAVVVNKFGNVITPTVDVKAWNDGGKKKIKF